MPHISLNLRMPVVMSLHDFTQSYLSIDIRIHSVTPALTLTLSHQLLNDGCAAHAAQLRLVFTGKLRIGRLDNSIIIALSLSVPPMLKACLTRLSPASGGVNSSSDSQRHMRMPQFPCVSSDPGAQMAQEVDTATITIFFH
eukprot:352987-Chlamydomonas_euryale.AAC.5